MDEPVTFLVAWTADGGGTGSGTARKDLGPRRLAPACQWSQRIATLTAAPHCQRGSL
jgi:hypothetical protein